MIKGLWGILGAKGFLAVLAILGVFVGSVYGLGRMHGYESYKEEAASLTEAALRKQRESDQIQHEVELKLALNKQRAKYEQQSRIRQVAPPNTSCELPPDCLRWADDVLHAATADFRGAAPTPPD